MISGNRCDVVNDREGETAFGGKSPRQTARDDGGEGIINLSEMRKIGLGAV